MLPKPESPKVNIDHLVGLRRCFILDFISCLAMTNLLLHVGHIFLIAVYGISFRELVRYNTVLGSRLFTISQCFQQLTILPAFFLNSVGPFPRHANNKVIFNKF